jgi:hypothetical protein
MPLRPAPIALLIALFVLPLYPKLGLIDVAGTYIPVRIDDLVIAAAGAIWIVALLRERRQPERPRQLSLAVALWLGVTLLAFLVGAFLLQSIGLLTGAAYWAKPIEYVLLGLMAYDLVATGQLPLRHLLTTVLGAAALVIGYGVLEHFGLVPHLPGVNPPPGGTISTMGDYHELASYLGLILILVLCLWPRADTRGQRIGLLVLGGAGLAVLFWTGTRSEYLALFAVFFGFLFWRPTRRLAVVAMVTMVVLFVSPVVGYFLFPPPGLQEAVTSGDVDLNDLGAFYNTTIRFAGAPMAYSLGERFLYKWPALIAGALQSPIVGLGPSAAGEAADGYYLRVFVESGLVGLVAFVTLIGTMFATAIRAARRSDGLPRNLAVAALAATAFVTIVGVLIDTWVASRVMELFWPLLGASLAAAAVSATAGAYTRAVAVPSATTTANA